MSVSDSASVRSSLRASALLSRPQITPMGPRTRKSRSNVVGSLLDSQNLSSTLDLHEFGAHPLSRPTSLTPPLSSSPSSRSDRMSLPAVSEEMMTPLDSAPAYEEETLILPPSPIQEDPFPEVQVAPAPPKLVPPSGIKFESIPIPWKALPLEAALWTLDSNELQDIVARAIRSSETFVRLLTLENLDNALPAELERLDTLKAATQSKYRFLVHRRTMLFQALNSSLISANHKNGNGTLVIGKLASQLTDTIAECEKLSEELLSISDQMAQINKLIDIHWGSAFAIALRKLNGSLSRRVADLAEARERITQLEIDVQEAWKEAEKVAQELDDYEAELTADDAEAVIEVAELVPIQPSSSSPPLLTHSRRTSTPTLLSIAPPSTTPTSPTTPRSIFGSQFIFPTPPTEKENETQDIPDTVSIRSSRSTRSAKSAKSTRGVSRASSVLAAKSRSVRASSLRFNKGYSKKQNGLRINSPQEHPPVPELPLVFTNDVVPTLAFYPSSTLLRAEPLSPSLRRQGSLDTLCTSPRSAAAVAFRGRSADDIYVRPYNPSSPGIQPALQSQVVSETNNIRDFPPMKDAIPVVSTSKSIPSMWMNVDSVKAPISLSLSSPPPLPPKSATQLGLAPPEPEPEPILVHPNSTKKNRYNRLKTLTKRYSTSLPIFSIKSSQGNRPPSRTRSD